MKTYRIIGMKGPNVHANFYNVVHSSAQVEREIEELINRRGYKPEDIVVYEESKGVVKQRFFVFQHVVSVTLQTERIERPIKNGIKHYILYKIGNSGAFELPALKRYLNDRIKTNLSEEAVSAIIGKVLMIYEICGIIHRQKHSGVFWVNDGADKIFAGEPVTKVNNREIDYSNEEE